MEFSPRELEILAIVQDNLPDSLSPYADIAEKAGMTEEMVFAFLARLRENGVIRRFGASIRHQQSGWNHNAMVAWIASREEAEVYGPIAASHSNVSHAYFRPSQSSDWPYTLYTMVHGRTKDECEAVIRELAAMLPLPDYEVLRSVRELKKTSMRYFE